MRVEIRIHRRNFGATRLPPPRLINGKYVDLLTGDNGFGTYNRRGGDGEGNIEILVAPCCSSRPLIYDRGFNQMSWIAGHRWDRNPKRRQRQRGPCCAPRVSIDPVTTTNLSRYRRAKRTAQFPRYGRRKRISSLVRIRLRSIKRFFSPRPFSNEGGSRRRRLNRWKEEGRGEGEKEP